MERAPRAGLGWLRSFKTWFGRIHTSFTAETGHATAHAPIRWFSHRILQDSIAKIDAVTGLKVPQRMTGHTRAEMKTYAMYHELGESYLAGYRMWVSESSASVVQRGTGVSENEFGALVADFVRGIYKGKDKNVKKVGEAVKKALKELEEVMVSEGMLAEPFNNPYYFPRSILTSNVTRLINQSSRGALDDFVTKAILSAYRKEGIKIEPKEAKVLANVYLTNINTRHYAVDYHSNGFLGDNSALLLESYLEKLGVESKVRERILKVTKVKSASKDPRHLRHRLLIDEGYTADVLGKDGKMHSVKVTDFFDNNAKRVMSKHIRQVYGALEMRKIGLEFNQLRGLSTPENPAPATWKEMTDFVERTAIAEGRNPREIEGIRDQMKRMGELVGGYVTEKPSDLGLYARMLQKFAGATYGGSFGLAAIAELGQPMAHSSLRAYLQHVKELPRLINDLRTGRISGELQKELAMFTGVGTEGRFFREIAAMLEHHPMGSGEAMSKVETVIGNLQNGAFKLGLLTPIDTIQRQYAAMLFSQEFLNATLKGVMPYSQTRLAQIGLSPEMTTTIMKHIKKHAKFEGKGNSKLQRFNFDDWAGAEGREAAAAMKEAIVLHTKKVIHQTHAGQLPRIMQNPIGRLLFQFRNFTIGSYETQLLSNLQAADARSLASFTTNTFFGLLSYLAIVNVKYGNQPKELEKYTEMSELVKGAFFRSGYATHLPMLIDTMAQFGGYQGVFSHGRSSGLSSGMFSLDGSPTGNIIDGLVGVGRGIIAPAFNEDYERSRQDYGHLRKVIPYQNSMYFSWLHDKIEEAFPEKSRAN